jgi:histidinol-phosphate/aromatic aminotransferase/cobyric acid decarboxylase-like protein
VASLAQIADSFFKPPVRDLVPYEPGKPVEEVQRELGLDRVVKLASNEGPFGPFPEAIEALAAAAPELNRYPDGGGYRLRTALAERHGVAGSVRNTTDGTVEAVFEGDVGAVERLVAFTGEGPRGAQVERVEVSEEEPEGLTGFSIR